jgi:hypothetical protein
MIRITFSGIVGLLLLSLPCAAQSADNQTISHEEEVVRAAYAKLSCATEIGYDLQQSDEGRGHADMSNRSSDDDRSKIDLRFEVTDFQVGQLSSLSSAPWTSLVSGPVKILNAEYRDLGSNSSNASLPESGARLFYAYIRWDSTVHEDVSDLVTQNHAITVTDYVSALQKPKNGEGWKRYASYAVVATQGEHRMSYRATFLFSGVGAEEEVWPLDYATAMTIAPFVTARLDPVKAVESVFSAKPLLRNNVLRNESCRWLIHHEGHAGTAKSNPKQKSPTTLPCTIEACRQTAGQLPPNCPAGDLEFSAEAGNITNTTSNSRPEFTCTWICVHSTRPELRERHEPWALLLIDGAPILLPKRD